MLVGKSVHRIKAAIKCLDSSQSTGEWLRREGARIRFQSPSPGLAVRRHCRLTQLPIGIFAVDSFACLQLVTACTATQLYSNAIRLGLLRPDGGKVTQSSLFSLVFQFWGSFGTSHFSLL